MRARFVRNGTAFEFYRQGDEMVAVFENAERLAEEFVMMHDELRRQQRAVPYLPPLTLPPGVASLLQRGVQTCRGTLLSASATREERERALDWLIDARNLLILANAEPIPLPEGK